MNRQTLVEFQRRLEDVEQLQRAESLNFDMTCIYDLLDEVNVLLNPEIFDDLGTS